MFAVDSALLRISPISLVRCPDAMNISDVEHQTDESFGVRASTSRAGGQQPFLFGFVLSGVRDGYRRVRGVRRDQCGVQIGTAPNR